MREVKPKSINTNVQKVNDRVINMQQKQKQYYHWERNEEFRIGETVLVKDYRNVNKPVFRKAIVIRNLGKCMYEVRVPELGNIWRRHINQIIRNKSYNFSTLPVLPVPGNPNICDNTNEAVLTEMILFALVC